MCPPEVESVMHGYVLCRSMAGLDQQKHGPTNKHGYISVSDTVMMATIILYTEKLEIPYSFWVCLCNSNLTMYPVWGTWKLPPGMCSDYWHHARTSELQSLQFYTFSVALDWHWHTGYTTYQYHKVSAAIFQLPLCSMNMDTRMLLF